MERATDRGKVASTLSLESRDPATRATTKTGEGDSAPHKHAVAARPSTRPAGAASTRALQAESPPTRMSYLKANPQQAPPKNNARREGIAQGPGPARPRRPLHIIQVERPANKAAPPKREADAAYPPQHARSALKNMSVERGKARPAVRGPFNKADAASYSPKPQPSAHTPSTSANPPQRRTTSVPTTITENATARAASTPSRGKRPPEPAPVPRAKRATARSTRVAPLAQARRHRVTCLELADRFPTAKPLNDGRTEPFRTSRRARWCAARGPSRTT